MGIVFLLSVVGAADNSGQTLTYVEKSINDFSRHYGLGTYVDVVEAAKHNEKF